MSYQINAKSRHFIPVYHPVNEIRDVEYNVTEETSTFDSLDQAKAKARELGSNYYNVVVWDTMTGEIMLDTLTGYEADI